MPMMRRNWASVLNTAVNAEKSTPCERINVKLNLGLLIKNKSTDSKKLNVSFGIRPQQNKNVRNKEMNVN